MSLRIDAEKVDQVLLPVVGWVNVEKGSFYLDSYEFVEDGKDDAYLLLSGGQEKLVPATGFGFTSADGVRCAGPLTSVLAVTYDESKS